MSEPKSSPSAVDAVYQQVRDAMRQDAGAPVGATQATEVPVAPGISVVSLRTPTLPPATHTNCYMVGTSCFHLVDPGAVDPDEQAAMIAIVERRQAAGDRLASIWLTHHHGDHVGAAARLATHFAVPVWAHGATAARLVERVAIARALDDDEPLAVEGAAPWRALFTPGHAPGHLCFVDDARRFAIVGDMVAGVGTILVDPSEGDMAAYLASLRQLRALGAPALLPAHGPVITDGARKLDDYVAHRLRRERQVLDAVVARGPARATELVPLAYADTPAWSWQLAERSLLAHLVKLRADGVVVHDAADDSWRVGAASPA